MIRKVLVSHSGNSSKPATDKFQVLQTPGKGAEPQRQPERIGPGKVRLSVSSHEQGVEICDVCGYVNRAYAFACEQCDVPLPSSVTSFRVRNAN